MRTMNKCRFATSSSSSRCFRLILLRSNDAWRNCNLWISRPLAIASWTRDTCRSNIESSGIEAIFEIVVADRSCHNLPMTRSHSQKCDDVIPNWIRHTSTSTCAKRAYAKLCYLYCIIDSVVPLFPMIPLNSHLEIATTYIKSETILQLIGNSRGPRRWFNFNGPRLRGSLCICTGVWSASPVIRGRRLDCMHTQHCVRSHAFRKHFHRNDVACIIISRTASVPWEFLSSPRWVRMQLRHVLRTSDQNKEKETPVMSY